jgi:hypothetical protein
MGDRGRAGQFTEVRIVDPVVLLLACSLLAIIALLPRAGNAEARLSVGISEQNPIVFSDSRFTRLGITRARLVLPIDEALGANYWRLRPWLEAAAAGGAEPMIAFNRSNAARRRLPTLAQYRSAVRNLRRDFPAVRTYTTWNEANHYKQPTARRPRRVGRYFNVLRSECRGCRIVGADVLDQRDVGGWLRRFRRTARGPRIWGLHNYRDANRRTDPPARSRTHRFAQRVPGKVWLTESGGIVRFGARFRGGPSGERRAARATRRAFALARSHPRITRLYLYHWIQPTVFHSWDSGLLRRNGSPRPAYRVVRRQLRRR